MAKEPKTTGEHLVSLYGHIKGLKKDIYTIKNNHLKHMHEDIDKTSRKIDYVLGLIVAALGVIAGKYFGIY
jgi:predicted membrane protein